jgi:uncharacterized membrane protein (DUF373 family)
MKLYNKVRVVTRKVAVDGERNKMKFSALSYMQIVINTLMPQHVH